MDKYMSPSEIRRGSGLILRARHYYKIGQTYKLPIFIGASTESMRVVTKPCKCVNKYPHIVQFETPFGTNVTFTYIELGMLLNKY